MLLILEIGLAIWAWKRGWKGWALLPIGIGLAGGFLIGFIMGASGASMGSILGVGLVCDILLIITLIVMIAKPRNKEEPVVFRAPVVYNTPPVYPVNPAAVEPYNPPVKVQPVTVIEPATVLAPVNKARLVLPDNSEIAINDSVKTVGRNDLNRLVPPEELKYISRQHIMIKSDGSRYYVEDQNSSNNTKVNGVNITGKGKQEIRDGDRIDLADTIPLTFKVSSAF
jgi:hypothetical protein